MNFDLNELLSLQKLSRQPLLIKVLMMLGVGIVVAIATFIISVQVVTKLPEQLEASKQEEKMEMEHLGRLQMAQIEAEVYQQAIIKAETLLNEISKKLPAGINAASFVQQLTDNAQQNGILVLTSRAEKEVSQNFIDEIPITISGCATYHQLGNFVANLSTLERIITLKQFSMTKSEVYSNVNLSGLATVRPQMGSASNYEDICKTQNSLPFTASISTYRYIEKKK